MEQKLCIRNIRLQDYKAIRALCERNGLTIDDHSCWVQRRALNPSRVELNDVSIGWVLENQEGEVVGTLGNIPRVYVFNGRRLRVAAASSWVVDANHRGSSILLAHRFFRQKNVDLLLNATASPEAQRVFRVFDAKRIPCPHYAEVMLWVTGEIGFARGVLRQLSVWGAHAMAVPVGLGLHAARWCRGQGRLKTSKWSVSRINGFDGRFDKLWTQMVRRRSHRLLAARDRASLQWHFEPAIKKGTAFVLAAEEDRRLVGYAIALRRDREDLGLRRLQVADLQVESDVAEVVQALMTAVLEAARIERIHAVEVTGLDSFKRRSLERLSPFRRRLPTFPFLYKALVPDVERDVESLHAWDPCLYDGDASL